MVPALEEFLTEQAKGVERSSQSKATAKIPTDGLKLTRAGDRWLVSFMVDPALNAIIVRGSAKDVAQVVKLVQSLYIQTNVKVKSYEVQFTNVQDVFETLEPGLERFGDLFVLLLFAKYLQGYFSTSSI